MKRALECEDDEEELQETLSHDQDDTNARKRRRGLIEKKRRDRINRCLVELRRLVPTALEKEGSSKLEKAEILHLTVEHLKWLRSTSGQSRTVCTEQSVTDYRAAGFQECLTEVAKYMATINNDECMGDDKARLMAQMTGRSPPVITDRVAGYHSHRNVVSFSPVMPMGWPLGLATPVPIPPLPTNPSQAQVKKDPSDEGPEIPADADGSLKTRPGFEGGGVQGLQGVLDRDAVHLVRFGHPVVRYPIDFPFSMMTKYGEGLCYRHPREGGNTRKHHGTP
ncbi:hairy/enhancer-of-split related with YRPW motif protein 2 [Nematostella vectensis]|uniref:Hes1 n=1 Tax=Nematostella vectensis TaxID=45351 RepID=G9JWI7_NEMVE|nr:hairy/enhancer-of-split related with YRPW motif protein 2 [Nematostella vectensis]AEW42993.1 Hes1 [Nematostella vectensis]